MILGTGVDLAEVSRIRDAIVRYGDRFVGRIFTAAEVSYVERKANRFERYAARFAAKEAAMKALGTGAAHGVYWTGIEVVRRYGPPQLTFHGGALARFQAMGATGSLLTLTHSRDLAIAHVMLTRLGAP